jgi:hypothetical protein
MLQAQNAGPENGPWDKLTNEERVRRVEERILHEVHKFWKRLRKAGLPFRYFLTSESHETGAPHLHWVLHETDASRRIRKRDLEEKWPHGFIAVRVVKVEAGGAGHKKVAAYVTKALGFEKRPRVCASQSYRPANRTVTVE